MYRKLPAGIMNETDKINIRRILKLNLIELTPYSINDMI